MILPVVGSIVTGIFGIAKGGSPKKGPDPLAQAARAKIMAHLRTNQCASVTELCRTLDLPWGVAQHHLYVLLKAGLVVSIPHGRHNFFYPMDRNQGRTLILALLRSPRAREIASAVSKTPGVRQKELLAELGLSRKVFRHHIELLVDAGLVVESKGGATRSYRPTELMQREMTTLLGPVASSKTSMDPAEPKPPQS